MGKIRLGRECGWGGMVKGPILAAAVSIGAAACSPGPATGSGGAVPVASATRTTAFIQGWGVQW
jgi:hypothetical protein